MRITATVQFHNELEFLDQWFKNAFKYADEIICGSHNPTDGSLEFVKSIKSDIPIRILEFPEDTIYKNGFSFIKNALIEQATGDWIVCLDADEEMEMDKDKLLKWITNGRHIAISTHTQHLHTESRQHHWSLDNLDVIKKEAPWIQQKHWRIFKNNVGIRWQGLIHEELRHPNGHHVSFSCSGSDIKMYHYGAMADMSKRSFKDGLYAELLLRLVENPELRAGTSRWWYTEYYEKNKEQLLKDREQYRITRKCL